MDATTDVDFKDTSMDSATEASPEVDMDDLEYYNDFDFDGIDLDALDATLLNFDLTRSPKVEPNSWDELPGSDVLDLPPSSPPYETHTSPFAWYESHTSPSASWRSTPDGSTPKPPLSAEQATFLEVAVTGRNIYVTGPAGQFAFALSWSVSLLTRFFPFIGSGKSFAISAFVHQAREAHRLARSPAGAVVVLATTGMAVSVLDVGARTINAFLATYDIANPNYKATWQRGRTAGVIEALKDLRVFILDEGTSRSAWCTVAQALLTLRDHPVSMLPEHGLGYFNFCLQQAHGNDLPFGGVQGIFVGDFYQVSALVRTLTTRVLTLVRSSSHPSSRGAAFCTPLGTQPTSST